MAEPFIGEIRMFGGNFAPLGWAFCDGRQLAISEYSTLFTLIGTTYGGDGYQSFNLPDLRGRAPVHQGNGFSPGQPGGTETITLTGTQVASHTHPLLGTSAGLISADPTNNLPAAAGVASANLYGTLASNLANFSTAAIAPSPASTLPHENRQPYLAISFIIALEGNYHSPS